MAPLACSYDDCREGRDWPKGTIAGVAIGCAAVAIYLIFVILYMFTREGRRVWTWDNWRKALLYGLLTLPPCLVGVFLLFVWAMLAAVFRKHVSLARRKRWHATLPGGCGCMRRCLVSPSEESAMAHPKPITVPYIAPPPLVLPTALQTSLPTTPRPVQYTAPVHYHPVANEPEDEDMVDPDAPVRRPDAEKAAPMTST